MKNLKVFFLAVMVFLCNTSFCHAIEMELDSFLGYKGDFSAYSKIFECNLGTNQAKHVSVIRGDAFYNGYFYAIKFEDEIVPLGKFLTFNKEDDRDFGKSFSDSVFIGCFGNSEKVLVIYGSFGGNRNDAIVLRYNKLYNEYEYISRRASGFPAFIYINNKDMMLVIDDGSRGMDEHYYIVGKYIGGKGQVDPNDMSNKLDGPRLPKREGYTIIPVELTPVKN